MRFWTRVALGLVLTLTISGLVWAQQAAAPVATQEGMSKQQADAILQELRQIRSLLERQQQNLAARAPALPQRAKLTLGSTPVLGKPDAAITIVEYTDYQCPYCNRFHTTVFDELKKNFIDTGKVRFISRDLPLNFHSNALKAAQAARCAGEDNYWAMRDLMIRNAKDLSEDALLRMAETLKIDREKFKACISNDSFLAEIRKEMAEANSLGVTGTPSFVIGKTDKNTLEGAILVGVQPYAVFEGKLNELLQPKP